MVPISPLILRQIALLEQRSYPEAFDLEMARMQGDGVEILLADLLPRLRFLSLSHSAHTLERWEVARRLLTVPAPRLQELTILGDSEARKPHSSLPRELLGGVAGRLQSLHLWNMLLPLDVSTYPALTNICSFIWIDEKMVDLNAAAFCRVLALMPALTTLRLDLRQFLWDAPNTALPILGPRTLSSFRLFAHYSINVLACLRYIRVPRCLYIGGITGNEFVRDIVQHPLAVSLGVRTAEVVVESGGPPLVVMVSVHVLIETESLPVRSHVSRTLFGALTRLALPEFCWPEASVVLPPLPALRVLRVTLAPCIAYARTRSGPFGILTCLDLATWDAPSLSAVQLAYCPPLATCRESCAAAEFRDTVTAQTRWCSCADTLPISLIDAYQFVAVYLNGAHGRRFSEITLSGVDPVDPNPWPALGLLQTMADSVSISYGAAPTQFEITDRAERTLGSVWGF
ncbi:hypothetical protein AURDEDRAFT_162035 [Auricularia subglabra TFB-10046 SS5]|nr:hypothetical protein AURDEDRAFT_162035 [Auricularia subglabra TFB-10046 SS5]